MFGLGNKDKGKKDKGKKDSGLQYDPKSGNYRTPGGGTVDGDVFAEAVSALEGEGASYEEAYEVASLHYRTWPEDGR